ncbi:OVOL1 [Cordylochernes scorpioides]|uniref:OVOL1 n=1 Tax=Cordylochernes scorpioides TaxID=51811 RepID=A0ABY6K6A2_9ARAC|nr:OVOL1 [Cordylochernes scorpioides]
MEEILKAIQAQNQDLQAQNQETREVFKAQNQELKESLGLKFKCLEDQISSVKEEMKEEISSVKEEMKGEMKDEISSVKEEMASLKERLAAVETGHPRTPVFQQENNNSGRPLVKVPTFDGKSSWTSFKTQFDVVAQANGWNVRDKASFLAAALREPAVEVLQMIPEQLRLDFNALIDALESRYGEEHYQKLHLVRFKNRLQDKKESLQDLAHDIRRLARLAYPTCPPEIQDFMAQHQFIDAIGDPETQRFVRLSSATTLQETLVQAMKYEAAQQATIESYRVARQVKLYNPETEKNRFWTRRAHDHMSPTCRRKVKQRGDTGCWKCGKNGHIRKHCPDNSKDKPEGKRGRCWTCGALDHISLTCPRKVKQRSDTDCWSCGQYGHMRRNCPENSETTTAPRRNHGRRNDNADALSRRPCVPQSGHCARAEERFCVRQVTVQESDEVEEKNWTGQAMRKAQREDRDLLPMINWKESGERPSWEDVASHSPKTKSLWRLWNSLTLRDGVLYRKWESEDGKHESWKLVLPRSHVPLALQEMHSSPTGDHFGIRKTLAKVRERFCWPGSRTDVEKWCRNCTQCSVRKGPTTRSRGKLKIYNVGAPFERMPAIHQCVGENFHLTSEKMKYRYYVKTSNKTFKEGEMVWLHNPQRKRGLSSKLQYQWEGPYKIIKCLNDVIFRIQKTPTSKPKVVHYKRLAPIRASCCLKRSDCCLPPTPVYFLEDSRRFYELLSPVLLLLSLTVLQLHATSLSPPPIIATPPIIRDSYFAVSVIQQAPPSEDSSDSSAGRPDSTCSPPSPEEDNSPPLHARIALLQQRLGLPTEVPLEFVNGGHGIKNPLLGPEERIPPTVVCQPTVDDRLACKVCGKTFTLQRLLNRHVKCHSDLKRYLCTFCGKGFNDTFDLKRHTRTHTGVRPYKCHMCEKSFTQRCSLESHTLKVHGIQHRYAYKERRSKVYVCEECGHTTGAPEQHYLHLQANHPYSPALHKFYDKRHFKFREGSFPALAFMRPSAEL